MTSLVSTSHQLRHPALHNQRDRHEHQGTHNQAAPHHHQHIQGNRCGDQDPGPHLPDYGEVRRLLRSPAPEDRQEVPLPSGLAPRQDEHDRCAPEEVQDVIHYE